MLKLQPRYGNSCTVINPEQQPHNSLSSIMEHHLFSYTTKATALQVHHYHKQFFTLVCYITSNASLRFVLFEVLLLK